MCGMPAPAHRRGETGELSTLMSLVSAASVCLERTCVPTWERSGAVIHWKKLNWDQKPGWLTSDQGQMGDTELSMSVCHSTQHQHPALSGLLVMKVSWILPQLSQLSQMISLILTALE